MKRAMSALRLAMWEQFLWAQSYEFSLRRSWKMQAIPRGVEIQSTQTPPETGPPVHSISQH